MSRTVISPVPGRSVVALTVLLCLLAGVVGAADQRGVYTLIREGVSHRVQSLSRDGVDLLSLRDLLEALGGVLGEGGPNEVRIEFGSIVVELEPGRGTASVDGEPHELSGPLVMALGNLWVPPDFVTEVMSTALRRASESVRAIENKAGAALVPVVAGQVMLQADIEVRSLRDYTRVLIRCAGSAVLPYTINAPEGRIVVRVQADNLSVNPTDRQVSDGALEHIAFRRLAGRGTFTLELGPDYRDHQTAVLRDPFRVVVDIYRRRPYDGPPIAIAAVAPTPPAVASAGASTPSTVVAEASSPADATEGATDLESAPTDVPAPAARDLLADATEAPAGPSAQSMLDALPRRSRKRFRTIVIDAGHGGNEVGARGPTGLLEKEVTLDLSRRLKDQLDRRLGLDNVMLTRTADSYLALEDRTGLANNAKADLFISIHANASLRSNARGAETYFLAASHAQDAWRTHIAQETGAVAEARGAEGTELELILWSLAQNQYLRESQALASVIQEELNASLGLRDRGVKQAPFKVLVGATMPAVLV